MSEIRETVAVREVRTTPATEGANPAGVVLAAAGLLAAGAVVLTGAAVVGAWKGAEFLMQKLRDAREEERHALKRLVPVSVASLEGRATATDSLAALASSGAAVSDAAALAPSLARVTQEFHLNPGSAAAASAVRQLCTDVCRQNTAAIQASAFAIATESAREIGFETVTSLPERGYILAENRSGESLRVDITSNQQTGGIAMATDTDGYDGEKCRVIHDHFYNGCRRRGLICEESRRRSKPPRMITGQQLPGTIRIGQ